MGALREVGVIAVRTDLGTAAVIAESVVVLATAPPRELGSSLFPLVLHAKAHGCTLLKRKSPPDFTGHQHNPHALRDPEQGLPLRVVVLQSSTIPLRVHGTLIRPLGARCRLHRINSRASNATPRASLHVNIARCSRATALVLGVHPMLSPKYTLGCWRGGSSGLGPLARGLLTWVPVRL
jgi:hypothetical protein